MLTLLTRKKGFTIVELVIVIAVIAILAAVLIPTFSAIIEKSEHSTDTSAVTNINKLLAVNFVDGKSGYDYYQIADTIKKGGYDIPLLAKTDGCSFYWIPGKNRVVLFSETENTVNCPNNLKSETKSDDWVNLSLNPEAPEKPHTDDTPDEEPKEPQVEEKHVLLSGESFNAEIKSLNGNVEKIVFDKTENCKDKITKTYKKVSSSGTINAYANGNDVYVLCDGNIVAPQNFSSAFSQMSKLKTVEFNNIDTSLVTDMSSMFYNCSALTQLDLSSFDTENVTKTSSMFENCAQLTNVYVTTSDKKWNMKKVTDDNSKEMFRECKKLPNYQTDYSGWEFLDRILDFFVSRDVTYAHVGNDGYYNGYLTEKK